MEKIDFEAVTNQNYLIELKELNSLIRTVQKFATHPQPTNVINQFIQTMNNLYYSYTHLHPKFKLEKHSVKFQQKI